MDLRVLNKLYIIESPSLEDIEAERMEGVALNAILRLAHICIDYFNVGSLIEFDDTCKYITQDIKSLKESGKTLGTATMHFSMNGNDSGMGLTNDDFINWEYLSLVLSMVNQQIEYLRFGFPNNIMLSPIELSFSVCEWYNAIKVNQHIDDFLYPVLIGPSEPVNWSELTKTFAVLYHNMLQKGRRIPIEVNNMNLAVGLNNVFKADLSAPLAI